MLLLQDVPRARASRLLRCDEKSLAAILTYWVHDAINRMDLSDTCSIAMDETSFRRGHKYVAVAIDADKRRVFDVEPGRDKTAVKNVGEKLERNGGNTKSVNSVTSDMSATMILSRNPEKRRTRLCVMPSGKWNRQASVCENWIC